MPRGPKGERRPADVIGNAVHVMKIATGEETETLPSVRGRDGGKVGGPSRAASLSKERRREIAKRAAMNRSNDGHRLPARTVWRWFETKAQ